VVIPTYCTVNLSNLTFLRFKAFPKTYSVRESPKNHPVYVAGGGGKVMCSSIEFLFTFCFFRTAGPAASPAASDTSQSQGESCKATSVSKSLDFALGAALQTAPSKVSQHN